MKLIVPPNTTSKRIKIFIPNTSKTDNAGLTGLAYNTAGLTWNWIRDGDSSTTPVSIVTATVGTFTAGGFKEVDPTNMPGVYELGVPNSAINGGDCHMILFGAANMPPITIEIQTSAVHTISNVKKNQALSNFEFMMTDSTNHAPATGKTVTCTRSIDGGTFGAGTLANVNEVASGLYRVDFLAADLNGNCIVLRATATGCDDTIERIITVP